MKYFVVGTLDLCDEAEFEYDSLEAAIIHANRLNEEGNSVCVVDENGNEY